ncbi:MAG: hypothetical protein P1U68_12755 [Verrucomicrobiales bacterium]|nr:hypothetical protein [Verrucomicrobiales bacterium]
MSTFVKHQRPRPQGIRLALALGVIWLVLLAIMWFAYRNSEGDGGGIMNFIGRFHILIVHLPIGVIFLAVAMDVLSKLTAFSHLARSLPFVLWIAFLGSIGATLVGYLLMSVEGFAGHAMDMHLYFGLGVVVATFLALFFSLRNQALLSTLAIFASVGASMATGHFGGAMVHEGDYLVEHAPEPLKPLLLAGLKTQSDATASNDSGNGTEEAVEIPLSDRLVYSDFVVPILEGKCNECHNENKIKGKLRMDTHELLLAGADGSDFPTVIPGDADESELIVRVTLPDDHDEFMPPKGDPLTAEEIQLLSLWIKAGAGTDLKIADLGDDSSIEATALIVESGFEGAEEIAGTAIATYESVWDTLSPEEQEERLEEVNDAAAKYHFSIMPISAEDDRLRVNVINAAKDFGDDQLALLEPVADRIVWLDLARSQITDNGLKVVSKMNALERLHLENTSVTDEGITHLGNLTGLEYLNLYNTKVGNGIFTTLAALPNLKKLYVWQTEVDPAEARAFERSVNLEINTGVAPASPAAVEETAADSPKPAPEKKDESTPAATKPTTQPAPAAKKEAKTPEKPAAPAAKKAAPTTPAKKEATAAKKAADTPPEPKAKATPKAKAAKD